MLLEIEGSEHGFAPSNFKLEGYTEEQIGYHATLLGEAGLAKVIDVTCMGSPSPEGIIRCLTWEGHEFIDSARENTIWNQAKELITTQVGGAAIAVWTAVLTSYVQKKLGLG